MEVTVVRLRGVAVDFVVDDGSGRPAMDPRIDFSPFFQENVFRGPRLDPFLVPRAAEGFHGIPVASEGGPDLVLIFSGGCEDLGESWLELPVGFPGYAPTTVVLPLRDVRRDGWTIDEVVLQPTAERWGRVMVRFPGVPPAALARMTAEDRIVGVLHLKDPEGRALVRTVAAEELGAGVEVELPAGHYGLDFEATEGYCMASEDPAYVQTLSVAESATTNATIDLSACGFTELHVTDPSGAPYTGRLIAEIDGKGLLKYVAWSEPPYLLSLLREGAYEARPYLPGLVGRDLYAFEVRQGELTHLALDGVVGEELSSDER